LLALAALGEARAPATAATQRARSAEGNEEPVFTRGVNTMLWHDSFDSVRTDSAMLAPYVTLNAQAIHLDSSAGLARSGAARIDWLGSSRCVDDSRVLEHDFPASPEVVVQYSVRYSPGFLFDWRRRGRCTGNAKKLFFLWAATGSRFDFISENHALGMGSDRDHPLFRQNVGNAVAPELLGDGEWHRITIRVRQSSAPDARDGAISGWIDGVLRWSYTGIASRAGGGWTLFKLPTTFNQGSPVSQSEWLDALSIWRP